MTSKLPLRGLLRSAILARLAWLGGWLAAVYAQRALLAAGQRQHFAAMRDAAVILDARRRLVALNAAAIALFGDDARRAVGQPAADALPLLLPILAADPRQCVLEITTPCGDCCELAVSISVLHDRWERAFGELVVMHDLSAERRLAAATADALAREHQLHDLSQTINSALELDTILQSVVERSVKLLRADSGALTLLNAEGSVARSAYLVNMPPKLATSFARGQGLFWKLVEDRQPLLENAYAANPTALPDLIEIGVKVLVAAPVVAGETLLGAIWLCRVDAAQPFGERDSTLLEMIGRQAGVAIHNVRLLEAARREAQESETLRRVGAVVAGSLHQEEAIERILEQLAHVVPYESASVQLRQGNESVIVGGRGFADLSQVLGMRFVIAGNNPARVIYEHCEPILLSDTRETFDIFLDPPHDHIRCWLGVPLIVNDQMIGMLTLDSGQPHTFTPHHQQLVTAFADHVAVTLENARLYQTALHDAKRRAVLHEVSQQIGACLKLDELYQTIHHAAERLMACQAFVIATLDEERQELEDVYLVDREGRWPGGRYQADQGLCGYVVRTRRTLLIDRLNDQVLHELGAWYFGQTETTVQSVLATPLRLGERVIGVISVQAYAPAAYTREEIELFEQLAVTAAIALENARLFAETQRLAAIDPLLGIYNRRQFFQLARAELERAKRHRQPFTVIMLDVDHFKQVNDTYGHLAGDQVLCEVAARCRATLRATDLLGRYGGEEFVILLPGTAGTEAVEVASRLREVIESAPFATDEGPITVTTSLGATVWRVAEDTRLDTLLDRADQALYEAKHAGRNCVRLLD